MIDHIIGRFLFMQALPKFQLPRIRQFQGRQFKALFKSHLIIAYNTHVTGLSQGLISGRITEIVSYMVQSCQLPCGVREFCKTKSPGQKILPSYSHGCYPLFHIVANFSLPGGKDPFHAVVFPYIHLYPLVSLGVNPWGKPMTLCITCKHDDNFGGGLCNLLHWDFFALQSCRLNRLKTLSVAEWYSGRRSRIDSQLLS